MDEQLGSATDIDHLLVFSVLDCLNEISRCSGTKIFGGNIRMYKKTATTGKDELSWTSRRDRVGFSNCLDLHTGAKVSASDSTSPNLWLIKVRLLRIFIRYLAGSARRT